MSGKKIKTLDDLFQRLGLNASNGLYFLNDTQWKATLRFPNRVARLLEEKIRPDAFFVLIINH
jgi:threonine aldolase